MAHRLAWCIAYGEWPSLEIDHINGDAGDNRLCNLRNVDRATNAQNKRRAQCTNKSGIQGVETHAVGRLSASVWVGGKRVYLGRFDTAEEAHAAYVAAKRRLHQGCTL
jgi:hypothetical protein